MNSLADGAHASLLQKSCSQAICSFCTVHTLPFFFVSVFPFSADKELYWLLTETKMELPVTFPSCLSTDSDALWMGEALRSWCRVASVQRLCPTQQKPTPITAVWVSCKMKHLKSLTLFPVCWSQSSGAPVNTTHMFCLSLCSLCQFCSLVLPKFCSTERKVRQMLTTPFKV